MVKTMVEIPNSAIDRLLRKGGATRVSKSAIHALQKELEEYGVKIAVLGNEIASHAGKKTIEGEDIFLAIRKNKMFS
jgi:histone H3/H4